MDPEKNLPAEPTPQPPAPINPNPPSQEFYHPPTPGQTPPATHPFPIPSQPSDPHGPHHHMFLRWVVILGLAILVLAVLLGGGAYVLLKSKAQPTPTPVAMTPTPTPDPTADWKTHSENLDWFGKISVKYPDGWTATISSSSGHPNFVTFTSPDESSCVKMSISSDEATLDEELRNGATNWNIIEPDNTVIESKMLTVNSREAKERYVTKDGKNFMDGGVTLGSDPRTSKTTVYMYLSSCGMQEKDVFSSILSSIKVESITDETTGY